MSGRWSAQDVPDQTGRVVVVTGATSGIGLETARVLGARGANLVMTGRNERKLEAAAAAVGRDAATPPEQVTLDLADLSSVADAAATITERSPAIDLLINNAGVMALPERSETIDGFETHLGTNHLGHFALTAALAGNITAAQGARVVTVSSTVHRYARIDLEDLHLTQRYSPWSAYGQSKLANLVFALELQRRFTSSGVSAISVAAHPGLAATDLQRYSSPARLSVRLLGQSASHGALPILYAATDDAVVGGGYYGPTGLFGQRGGAGSARVAARALDAGLGGRLWEASEQATGVDFPATGAA